jgi:hypothetical protein
MRYIRIFEVPTPGYDRACMTFVIQIHLPAPLVPLIKLQTTSKLDIQNTPHPLIPLQINMPAFQDMPRDIKFLILDYAHDDLLRSTPDPLLLVSRQVHQETKEVRKFNTGVIGISDWYISPKHFHLDFHPLDVELKVKMDETSPFPDPQIAGFIATTTQFYDNYVLLSNAVAKIGPNVRRLISRPMPRPYDVAITIHFDQSSHPKVEFLFMSEEKQVGSEEDQAEWFDSPKKHWRENLIAGMDAWSARAGPARYEMWYIRMFIGVVKKYLPKDLPWATGVEVVQEEDKVKDW